MSPGSPGTHVLVSHGHTGSRSGEEGPVDGPQP